MNVYFTLVLHLIKICFAETINMCMNKLIVYILIFSRYRYLLVLNSKRTKILTLFNRLYFICLKCITIFTQFTIIYNILIYCIKPSTYRLEDYADYINTYPCKGRSKYTLLLFIDTIHTIIITNRILNCHK